ncbi:MAG: PKD domain-containing protein, partial [Candidatus Thermoplasmatota archaeon]|nr:PKD domain-containing protein [Candidatus Thermoplasmatota archaeon]
MKRVHIGLIATFLLTASLAGCIGDDAENKKPLAEAGVDIEVEVGEEVVFQGTGLDDDGSIVTFQWDFDGDGEWDWSGDIGARIHVYDRPGNFEAVLQVEDDEGAKTTDTRWVNVTATVFITIDWTSGSAFVIHVSERLVVAKMEVDWTMEAGGPIPITRTFTHDAGLDKLNDTTYTVDPSVVLIAGQRHFIKVRLGDVVIARMEIEVVDVSNAKAAYDATYQHSLADERIYAREETELWRNGTLSVESRIGWTVAEFNGSGIWWTYTNRSGVITIQWVTIDEAAARMGLGGEHGDIWWRYVGHGSVNQTSETGFFVHAFVWDFEREMDNGSLVKDDWRRVGRY